MVGRTRRNAPGEGAAGQATKAHDRQGKKQTKRPVTLDKEEERIEIKSKEALPEVKTKLIPFKKNDVVGTHIHVFFEEAKRRIYGNLDKGVITEFDVNYLARMTAEEQQENDNHGPHLVSYLSDEMAVWEDLTASYVFWHKGDVISGEGSRWKEDDEDVDATVGAAAGAVEEEKGQKEEEVTGDDGDGIAVGNEQLPENGEQQQQQQQQQEEEEEKDNEDEDIDIEIVDAPAAPAVVVPASPVVSPPPPPPLSAALTTTTTATTTPSLKRKDHPPAATATATATAKTTTAPAAVAERKQQQKQDTAQKGKKKQKLSSKQSVLSSSSKDAAVPGAAALLPPPPPSSFIVVPPPPPPPGPAPASSSLPIPSAAAAAPAAVPAPQTKCEKLDQLTSEYYGALRTLRSSAAGIEALVKELKSSSLRVLDQQEKGIAAQINTAVASSISINTKTGEKGFFEEHGFEWLQQASDCIVVSMKDLLNSWRLQANKKPLEEGPRVKQYLAKRATAATGAAGASAAGAGMKKGSSDAGTSKAVKDVAFRSPSGALPGGNPPQGGEQQQQQQQQQTAGAIITSSSQENNNQGAEVMKKTAMTTTTPAPAPPPQEDDNDGDDDSEEVLIPPTGDKMRDMGIRVLAHSLTTATTAVDAAREMEYVLFARYCSAKNQSKKPSTASSSDDGGDEVDETHPFYKDYCSTIMKLYSVLSPKSKHCQPLLRHMLFSGMFTPAEFAVISAEELAVKQKEAMEQLVEGRPGWLAEQLRNVRLPYKPSVASAPQQLEGKEDEEMNEGVVVVGDDAALASGGGASLEKEVAAALTAAGEGTEVAMIATAATVENQQQQEVADDMDTSA